MDIVEEFLNAFQGKLRWPRKTGGFPRGSPDVIPGGTPGIVIGEISHVIPGGFECWNLSGI